MNLAGALLLIGFLFLFVFLVTGIGFLFAEGHWPLAVAGCAVLFAVLAMLAQAAHAEEINIELGAGIAHQYSLQKDGLWAQQGANDQAHYTVKAGTLSLSNTKWRLGYTYMGEVRNTGGLWLTDADYANHVTRTAQNQLPVNVYGQLRYVSLERKFNADGWVTPAVGALYYDRSDHLNVPGCPANCDAYEHKGGLRPMLALDVRLLHHVALRYTLTGNTKTRDGITGGSGGIVNLKLPGNAVFELVYRYPL